MQTYKGLRGLFLLLDDVSFDFKIGMSNKKQKIEKSQHADEKTKIQFFVTDAGILLRRNKDIWQIFNAKSRRWEEPLFDISDIYDTLLISPGEAGEIVKYLLRSKH